MSNAMATALSRRASVLLRYDMMVLPLAHCFFCFKNTNPCGKVDWVLIPHLYFWASHVGMVWRRVLFASEGESGSGVKSLGSHPTHVVLAALR